MKKIIILLLSSLFAFTSASAVGLKAGIGGTTSVFHATGQDNENGELSHEDATGVVGYAHIFVEVHLNDRFGIGINYSPDALSSETADEIVSDVDGTETSNSNKTNATQVDFEDLTQVYLALNLGENLYARAGMVAVDVITNESLATGSQYDNTDMDGTVFGLGYDRELDNGIFFRVEGAYMEFDDKSLTSTTNSENTITLKDLQGASASISIGKAF